MHWDLLRSVKIRPSSSPAAVAWLLAIARIHIMIPNRGYCIKKIYSSWIALSRTAPINISWEWEKYELSPFFMGPHKRFLSRKWLLGLRIADVFSIRQGSATQIPSGYSLSCSGAQSVTSHCQGLSRSTRDMHIRMILCVAVNGNSSGRLKNTG